jgi:hypothetical protein
MASFLNQELTNVGWDALSTALGGGRLSFFKMQAGDGTIGSNSEIASMTGLVNPITDIAIHSYHIEGEGQVTLVGNLSSRDLDAGFTFRELGVFAVIEDPPPGKGGTPGATGINVVTQKGGVIVSPHNPVVPEPGYGTKVMYSYTNNYTLSDYIPGRDETTDVINTIQVTVKIDREANIQIIITAGQQLSVTNIGGPEVGAGPWSYTQANVAYLKRFVPGAEIEIAETSDVITIGKKQLHDWLVLYVNNSYTNQPPYFRTIPDAYNYVRQFSIPSWLGCYIIVSEGIYYQTDTYYLDHAQGNRIYIIGDNGVDIPNVYFSSVGIAGGPWNYTVTLYGISDMRHVRVGSYLNIWHAGGSSYWGNALLTGCFPVTAVSGNSATIWVRCVYNWPDMTGFQGGYFHPCNTILVPPQNRWGVYVTENGLGLWQSMIVRAPNYPSQSCCGFTTVGPTWCIKSGVYGFNPGTNGECCHAFYAAGTNGSIYARFCCATDNHSGFVSAGGANICPQIIASTHNSLRGIWVESGYVGVANGYVWLAGNWLEGIVCSDGSGIFILDYRNGPSNVFAMYNRTAMTSWGGSRIAVNPDGSALHAIYNRDWDVETDILSYFNSQSRVFGSRRFNHPIGQLSWSGSLIL